MARKIISVWLFIMLFCVSGTILAQETTTWEEQKKITTSRGTETLKVVWINLNNPKIQIESVAWESKIGATGPLQQLVQSETDKYGTGVAGINGTYFNSNGDLLPVGTLIQDGSLEHIQNTGAIATFDVNNVFQVQPLFCAIEGGINDQWEWPYNWYASNINHFTANSGTPLLFDHHYGGPKPSHTYTGIVVSQGIVTSIKKSTFDIPAEGFLILTQDQKVIDHFKVGYKVAYRVKGFVNNFNQTHSDQSIDVANIRTAVGAGPTYVKNGKSAYNPLAEAFKDTNLINMVATRSLIGVTANNQLAMVVVPKATMKQMPEIALALGLVQAMGLDGGSSSGIYHQGNYVVKPGRTLNNAIVVKVLHQKPIKITMNGQAVFFDVPPFIQNDTTMVPLRQIMNALEAQIAYDATTGIITATRFGTTLQLMNNQTEIQVNGVAVEVPIAPTIVDGRIFVPVRIISEYLGATVVWEDATSTVRIQSQTIGQLLQEAAKEADVNKSLSKYLTILQLEPTQITALKVVANTYHSKLKQYDKAIPYYNQITQVEKDFAQAYTGLGWSYYGLKRYADAMAAFNQYILMKPNEYLGYYGVALCYASYELNDSVNAKKYFKKVLEKSPTEGAKADATQYINTH